MIFTYKPKEQAGINLNILECKYIYRGIGLNIYRVLI